MSSSLPSRTAFRYPNALVSVNGLDKTICRIKYPFKLIHKVRSPSSAFPTLCMQAIGKNVFDCPKVTYPKPDQSVPLLTKLRQAIHRRKLTIVRDDRISTAKLIPAPNILFHRIELARRLPDCCRLGRHCVSVRLSL